MGRTYRRLIAVLVVVLVPIVVAYAWWRMERPPLLAAVSFSQAVYAGDGRLLRLSLAADEQYRLRLPLARFSPQLIQATLLQEDRYFRWHPGVNPAALARGAWRTYLTGTRRVGGSTLSMQLVRIQFGIDSRRLSGKLRQILYALRIELRYSKDEILEAYLNRVSYGGNIQGAAAASLIYFGKDVSKLSLVEALTLSVIPQNPTRRRPAADGSPASAQDELLAARGRLYARWRAIASSDTAESAAFALPFSVRTPAALPFLAPHHVDAMLRDYPRASELHTTLDPALQEIIEQNIHRFVERKRGVGVRNAAALLVDHRTMQVKAAVGSAGFFDAAIQGQVNGTRAQRSPGSTLKPFIYALGIEQGVIHPLSMLKDAPTSFSGYNPENFDREFIGPVQAHDALIKSRNLPAVYVATRLARPSLYEFLRDAGVSGLRTEAFYGLALVLGGAEMSMEELVQLYAMLASGGVLKSLRTLADAPVSDGRRMLSPEASYLVLDILKDNPRPAHGLRALWARDPMPVYWKTGTSYAFRDAWSIGIVGPYVLAVWVGNFDGAGNPAFVGAEVAAPLMFDMIDALRAREPEMQSMLTHVPTGLAQVQVCAVSGHIPGRHCRHTVPTWFIPGKSPIKICEVHRALTLDLRTGLRACSADAPGTRTEVYEFWPSDLLNLFRQAGIPRRTPPPDNPRCSLQARATRGQVPQITSPQAGLVYTVRASRHGAGDTIPLQAVTDADARVVHWFLDEKYLGQSASGKPLFWPAQPGSYVVRAVDDQGRSGARDLKVSVVE